MAKDPDIKSSKKKTSSKAKTKSKAPASKKNSAKSAKKSSASKNLSFKQKLDKLGVDPEKNKKTIKWVGIGALIALVLTIFVFGVLIYKYRVANRAVKIASKIIPYPVASVNGNIIWNTATYNDYLFELASVQKFYQSQGQDLNSEEGRAKMNQLKNDIIKQLEDNIIIEQAAKKYGINVTNKEVDEQFNQLVENAGGIDKVKATLDKLYGWNTNDFKNKIRQSLVQRKLADKILADESLNEPAKKQAADVLAQVKAGGDFGELAKKYSSDGTASGGGDLGFFGKGQMVPEFEAAAFALQPGQVSEVVKTQYGYHIIKVTEAKDGQVRASHILIKGVDLDSWLRDQRAQARIAQYFFPN